MKHARNGILANFTHNRKTAPRMEQVHLSGSNSSSHKAKKCTCWLNINLRPSTENEKSQEESAFFCSSHDTISCVACRCIKMKVIVITYASPGACQSDVVLCVSVVVPCQDFKLIPTSIEYILNKLHRLKLMIHF